MMQPANTRHPAANGGALPSLEDDEAAAFDACRILIAEDNPVNQQFAVRMLEKLGGRADVAANGHQAVFMHAARVYDLLLMDCQMPGLDGYQAAARIRASEKPPRHTPIIALTAGASRAQRDRCFAAGMDDVMPKPIQPRILRQTLRRWLLPAAPDGMASGDKLEAMHAAFGADFTELAALYLRDSPKRIAGLRAAGATGDSRQIMRIAHAFAGSCASIGAGALAALCKRLESRAAAEVPDGLEHMLAEIEAEYWRVSAKLQSMSAPA